ncbi:MAG: 50S ribosomal protein L6 [Thermales bacterium]|nr:50S ribosomal protein L6 [Thermales bacterium]
MSRVGKKEIMIPSGVIVDFDKSNNIVTVKGTLGELKVDVLDFVSLAIDSDKITVKVDDENTKFQRSMWGTTRSLIQNAIAGVSQPFKKEIELNGVGYKMALSGANLVLNIGYSHPITVEVPGAIKLKLNKNVLEGECIDKQLIGDFFTSVHNMKPADPYKHKGFKFPGRYYRKKVGKKAK